MHIIGVKFYIHFVHMFIYALCYGATPGAVMFNVIYSLQYDYYELLLLCTIFTVY